MQLSATLIYTVAAGAGLAICLTVTLAAVAAWCGIWKYLPVHVGLLLAQAAILGLMIWLMQRIP